MLLLFIKNFNNIWHLSSLNYSSQRKSASPQHTRQGSIQSGCLKTQGKRGAEGRGGQLRSPSFSLHLSIYLTVLTPRSPGLKPKDLAFFRQPPPPPPPFGMYWLTAAFPVCLRVKRTEEQERSEKTERQNDVDVRAPRRRKRVVRVRRLTLVHTGALTPELAPEDLLEHIKYQFQIPSFSQHFQCTWSESTYCLLNNFISFYSPFQSCLRKHQFSEYRRTQIVPDLQRNLERSFMKT